MALRKSKSRRSLQDETDETRRTSRSRYDDRSVSRESFIGQGPLSGRKSTGKAGATEATRHLDEGKALPSARYSMKDGRSPSVTTTRYNDKLKSQRSSDLHQKFSDVREESDRRESEVSRAFDRRSSRRTKSLDEDVQRTARPDERAAGARAATDGPTRGRAIQPTSPTRRSSRILGGTPIESRTSPSASAKTSRMRYDSASRSARSDGAMSRGSPPDRDSPPRRSSSKASKIRSDESRSDRRSGALGPRIPRDPSSLPPRTSSRASRMSDDIESRYSRSDQDVMRGSPLYRSRPSRSSKTSRVRDDYESRISQRSRARSLDSPPDRTGPSRRSASEAYRLRDDYELRTDRRSSARRHDSTPDGSSPPRRASYRTSIERGDYESPTGRRRSARRYDSPLDRSSPPRRTSRTPRERDDYESRSDRRSRSIRSDSPPDRYSHPRSVSDVIKGRDDYESRTERRHGSRRYDRTPEHSSPPRGASWTSWLRNYYGSPTDRRSGESSPRSPSGRYSSPGRVSSKTSRKGSDFESSTARWRGARESGRSSPRRRSGSKESRLRDDFEPRAHRRSGSISPGSPRDQSIPPSKKPSTSNVYKASSSRGEGKTDTAVDVKPMPKADTAVVPCPHCMKLKAASSAALQPKPTDVAVAVKDAQKPKPVQSSARGVDMERTHHPESEEESEETPKPKPVETPSSEEYVPPSQAGQVAPQVVESLGPFSDDDEEFQYEEYEESSIGWFRMWVLCSVAAIVLMIPFALTLMSYEAAGKFIGGSGPSGAKEETAWFEYCESPNYSQIGDLNLRKVPPQVRTPSVDKLSLRKLFCVYDILKLPREWIASWDHFPFEHCTDIIVYSYYVDRNQNVQPKRRILVNGKTDAPFPLGDVFHRGVRTNVYVTVGGSRADSPAMGQAIKHAKPIYDSLFDLVAVKKLYTGVNVDWDHPNDDCDFTDGSNMHEIVQRLSDQLVPVLITVPPDADIVKHQYRLFTSGHYNIKYIIVATHRLRDVGLVSCTGGQKRAVLAYWSVRKVLEPVYSERVIHSIALGGDVFNSKKMQLGAPGELLSHFYGKKEEDTPKMSYRDVCLISPVQKTDQCTLYAIQSHSSGYKVVACAGAEQLRNRHMTASGDAMTGVPIVVYDIHLDDYSAACDGIDWPLLRAVATKSAAINLPSGK